MSTNSKAVAKTDNNKPAVDQREQRVLNPAQKAKSLMDQMMPQIIKALPKYITPDRLARIILTEVSNNTKLMDCTKESFLGAVMQSAELGLAPGTLGQCYFIPFNKSKKVGREWLKQSEVTFMIGYKGYLELFRRSGEVSKAMAKAVHVNDDFTYSEGTDGGLRHTPNLRGDRGDVFAYYFYAKFTNGEDFAYVMSKDEVIEHRKNTKKSDSQSPWDTDFDAMACKTCIRLGAKYMPISAELMHKISQDETVRRDTNLDGISTDQYIGQHQERVDFDFDSAQEVQAEEVKEEPQPKGAPKPSQPQTNQAPPHPVDMSDWQTAELGK